MRRHLGFVTVVIAICLMAGCANTPVERQEATSKSLAELHDDIIATRSEIGATLVSLNALLAASESNLRDTYDAFNKDVGTIERQARAIEEESRQMQRRRETWLSDWKQAYSGIQNPELRAVTEQRREQVLLRFHTVDGSLLAAHQALTPFIGNLQDIRKAFGYDLTPRGIAAVSATTVVPQANANGKSAARSLDVASADLQALLAVLTPAPSR